MLISMDSSTSESCWIGGAPKPAPAAPAPAPAEAAELRRQEKTEKRAAWMITD